MIWQMDQDSLRFKYVFPRLKKITAAGLAMFCLCPLAYANDALENRLKAAFIYNFTQFIEWPDTFGSDTLNICALGKNALSKELATVEGKYAQGKPIAVKYLNDDKYIGQCHVLFVRVSNSNYRASLLQILEESPVLTVSDSKGFVGAGGIIQFFLDNNRVRFAINNDAAERAGLSVSSKLLSLARIVSVDEMAGL